MAKARHRISPDSKARKLDSTSQMEEQFTHTKMGGSFSTCAKNPPHHSWIVCPPSALDQIGSMVPELFHAFLGLLVSSGSLQDLDNFEDTLKGL